MGEGRGIYSVAMFQAGAWSHVALRALFLFQSGPPAPKAGTGPPIPRLGPGAVSRPQDSWGQALSRVTGCEASNVSRARARSHIAP